MRISDWSSDVCSSDLDALMDPDELLEDVERSGDLGRIAWAAHTVMTPKERAALNDRGRRRLGRAIAIVALDHIDHQIGRASCRDRVWPYVSVSGVRGSLKKQKQTNNMKKTSII